MCFCAMFFCVWTFINFNCKFVRLSHSLIKGYLTWLDLRFGSQQRLNEWRQIHIVSHSVVTHWMYFSILCSLRWFAVDFFARGLYTRTVLVSCAHLSVSQDWNFLSLGACSPASRSSCKCNTDLRPGACSRRPLSRGTSSAVRLQCEELTRSQAVARIADRTAKIVGLTWPRPRPLSGKIICAAARHCPYKAAYYIWSL